MPHYLLAGSNDGPGSIDDLDIVDECPRCRTQLPRVAGIRKRGSSRLSSVSGFCRDCTERLRNTSPHEPAGQAERVERYTRTLESGRRLFEPGEYVPPEAHWGTSGKGRRRRKKKAG